jgi:hypothetical protein
MVWLETLVGRDISEDLGVDGKIILEYILRKYGSKVWMHMDQERGHWQAVVNKVMNLRVP